jgi:hypothetical protein
VEGVRFVVRDGAQFYVSEAVFQGAGQKYGGTDGKQHVLCPLRTKWAKYQPRAPYHIEFDPKTPFAPHTFEDVTAVGFYAFKDTLIPSYFGFKPDAAKDIPPFYISTTEVPYLLWKKVFRLARSNTFVRDPRGFIFDCDGDMGSMRLPGPDGKLLRHSPEEPVTHITFFDALAWCNALSQQESRTPCYYEDSDFKTVFRYVKQSPLFLKPYALPKIYVKWAADGYRLPTQGETTYALWRQVYDWALANGCQFDRDAAMGSMGYWGFEGWGEPHAHSPDEPVTDLSVWDVMVWCNALSLREGRTPVYYADEACTKPYKTAFVYRPLMMLFFEAAQAEDAGLISHAFGPRSTEIVFVKTDADGYRLPQPDE